MIEEGDKVYYYKFVFSAGMERMAVVEYEVVEKHLARYKLVRYDELATSANTKYLSDSDFELVRTNASNKYVYLTERDDQKAMEIVRHHLELRATELKRSYNSIKNSKAVLEKWIEELSDNEAKK